MEDYVQVVCDQIERIPEDVIIERVTGDGARSELIAPLWSLKKFCVMNEIDKELYRRGSFQGAALRWR
jgi:radical SAM superfamily enzyme